MLNIGDNTRDKILYYDLLITPTLLCSDVVNCTNLCKQKESTQFDLNIL